MRSLKKLGKINKNMLNINVSSKTFLTNIIPNISTEWKTLEQTKEQ